MPLEAHECVVPQKSNFHQAVFLGGEVRWLGGKLPPGPSVDETLGGIHTLCTHFTDRAVYTHVQCFHCHISFLVKLSTHSVAIYVY